MLLSLNWPQTRSQRKGFKADGRTRSFENRFAHIDVTFHDPTRRAEYAQAFYLHLPVNRFGFGLHREGAAWVADIDRRSCPGRFPEHVAHDRAGHTCGGAGAETAADLDGLVCPEHEHGAGDEVDLPGFYRCAADGSIVGGRTDNAEERDIGTFGLCILRLVDHGAHHC